MGSKSDWWLLKYKSLQKKGKKCKKKIPVVDSHREEESQDREGNSHKLVEFDTQENCNRSLGPQLEAGTPRRVSRTLPGDMSEADADLSQITEEVDLNLNQR